MLAWLTYPLYFIKLLSIRTFCHYIEKCVELIILYILDIQFNQLIWLNKAKSF